MYPLIKFKPWFFLITLLGLFSSTAFAQQWRNEGPKKITQINTGWAGEGILVITDSPSAFCGGNAYSMLIANNPMFKENLSILLSALHANSSVSFIFQECDASGYPKLKAINIIR